MALAADEMSIALNHERNSASRELTSGGGTRSGEPAVAAVLELAVTGPQLERRMTGTFRSIIEKVPRCNNGVGKPDRAQLGENLRHNGGAANTVRGIGRLAPNNLSWLPLT